MPYDPNDPRSALANAAPVTTAPGVPRRATYFEMDELPPDETHERGSRTWWTRSQAVIVGFTRARTGERLTRAGQADEYVVLVIDPGTSVTVSAGDGQATLSEPGMVVVPPGDSAVDVDAGGVVVRLFATTASDLAGQCRNSGDYADADGNVAEFRPWPDPPAGHALRVYPISAVPDEPGRFGRIFRCSTLMVNLIPATDGPRDPAKLSPHHHDDFEQISLHVAGDYVHHMRAVWMPDSTTWQDDEHRPCKSPAVVVIPPPMIHTSQAVGAGRHWLIDIFAPPRRDFSERPGWVLNADEYPMPV